MRKWGFPSEMTERTVKKVLGKNSHVWDTHLCEPGCLPNILTERKRDGKPLKDVQPELQLILKYRERNPLS